MGAMARWVGASLTLLLGAAACGNDRGSAEGSASADASSSSASSTSVLTEDTSATGNSGSTGDGPSMDRPEACEGLSSPFVSADCLVGLRDRCRAANDAAACEDVPALAFDGGFLIMCGWAKVVSFSDVASCTIEAVQGRCEAGVEQLVPCFDKCTDTPDLHASLHANILEAELVEMPCAPDGKLLGGPLGPASAVGAPPGETGTCAPDLSPPAPEICDCAPIACAAE